MNHLWTLICRGISIDRETNNVSVFDILEELAAVQVGPEGVPKANEIGNTTPLMIEILTLWARDIDDQPEERFGRLEIVIPNGESIVLGEFPVDLTKHRRSRSRARMLGFPATTSGKYFVRVSKKDTVDAQWSLAYQYPLDVMLPAPSTNNGDSTG